MWFKKIIKWEKQSESSGEALIKNYISNKPSKIIYISNLGTVKPVHLSIMGQFCY